MSLYNYISFESIDSPKNNITITMPRNLFDSHDINIIVLDTITIILTFNKMNYTYIII